MECKYSGDAEMNNLSDLVPPLELCKKIPEGEFDNSVHWYRWSYTDRKYLLDRGKPDVRFYRDPCPCGMKYFYPAPTLKEILIATPLGEAGVFCFYLGDGDWGIGDCERDLYVKNGSEGKSPEAGALKWWLKNRGVE
jgi:hypothetical protein